jgi:hypothetical protein
MPDEIDNLISEVIRDYRGLAAELYSVIVKLEDPGRPLDVLPTVTTARSMPLISSR